MLFEKKEYKERLKKVKESMQKKGIDLLVSHDPANMNYLTGYDAWSFYYAQCVLVHINEDEPICFLRAQDAGGGYIKTNRLSLKKSLFNARHHSTTGMTFMTYARFHASADQHIITLAGDETNPAFELIYRNGYDEKSWQGGSTRSPTGLIEFNNYLSSVTAGSITGAINSDGDLVPNTMGAPYPIELNKWYHIAATISATGSKSGMTIYINGENAVLMGSESSISAAAPAAATGNVVAMASPTNPYAAFGSAKQGNGATGSPIDIGLTRIFTRPLSHSEVFQNYIATIPGNVVLDTIKIG